MFIIFYCSVKNTTSKMKGETLKYSIVNRKSLTGDEADLHDLANLAGIVMDQNVFKLVHKICY